MPESSPNLPLLRLLPSHWLPAVREIFILHSLPLVGVAARFGWTVVFCPFFTCTFPFDTCHCHRISEPHLVAHRSEAPYDRLG